MKLNRTFNTSFLNNTKVFPEFKWILWNSKNFTLSEKANKLNKFKKNNWHLIRNPLSLTRRVAKDMKADIHGSHIRAPVGVVGWFCNIFTDECEARHFNGHTIKLDFLKCSLSTIKLPSPGRIWAVSHDTLEETFVVIFHLLSFA